MWVKAVGRGWVNNRMMEPGAIFELLDDRLFSDVHRTDKEPGWMERIPDPKPLRPVDTGTPASVTKPVPVKCERPSNMDVI